MARIVFSLSLAGKGERLTGISSANKVDGLGDFAASDVVISLDAGPMFFEYRLRVGVVFNLPPRFKSARPFESKFDASYP